MLTIKQVKENAYVFAVIMERNVSIKQAVSSINNICNLDITEGDLKCLIRLRVHYFNIDKIFSQYEV